MNAKKQYWVTSYDDTRITLKDSIFLALSTVSVQKDQITSVRNTMGILTVETTGGATYRVLPGMRKAQRARTDAAFGYLGVHVSR